MRSDPVDHDDLSALLERYDSAITDAPPKIGSGVVGFVRRLNRGPGYTSPGFWVIRTDGSETDFSFYTAVEGQPKSEAYEFADACRAAVSNDLRAAKKRHFDRYGDAQGRVLCDLTDASISFDEAHLDHAYPSFGQMVVMFRAARGWHAGIPSGVLTPSQ